MARWLVPLAGERFDIEEFVRWFPSGGIHVIEEDDHVYLVGPDLEVLTDAEAVYNEAQRMMVKFARIILLLEPSLKCPTIDGVTRETDEGKRHKYIFASVHLATRAKLTATATVGGTEEPPPQNTVAQEMLQRVNGDPHLEAAMTLWGKPERSWPHLYRILEEIEQHLGERADIAGQCTKADRKIFMRTANAAEVSGIDGRHALGRFVPPDKPMTIQEANEFIGRLLIRVLR